jgi:hypothetical protein
MSKIAAGYSACFLGALSLQPANSSRWGIELGIFIAAIQGSETLPLALRIY